MVAATAMEAKVATTAMAATAMVATSMASMMAVAATTTVTVVTRVLLAAILVASSALGRATNSLHDVLRSVSCRQLLQLMRMGCAAANA
eukprot:233755-Pleurochrysis_carterae.AAC.1